MRRTFLPMRRVTSLGFTLLIITILILLHSLVNYTSIRLFNTGNNALHENACIIYARKLAHNLTVTTGWETSNYLSSLGSTIHNTTQYWNEDDRFRQFNFSEGKTCSIIYCGANTVGKDGMRFAREYPTCHIWFLEPVPVFYEQFVHSSDWKLLMASNASSLYHAHCYGLSNRSIFTDMAENTISHGQGFSLISEQKVVSSHQRTKLIIRDVSEILFELKILTSSNVDSNNVDGELKLLHMNCEGCEYDVIERLIDTHLMKHVRYLQFGSHRPRSIQSTIAERYCSLQEQLSNTHSREFGIPWAWERWELH